MEKLKLVKFKNPFNRFDKEAELVDYSGENLLELRKQHFPEDIEVVIHVNGTLVPETEWQIFCPKKNDFISILPSIKGGALKIIAGVILIIIGAVLLGPSYGISSYLIAAGIGLIIGGVVELLFPIKKPQIPSFTGEEYDSSQVFGWSPATVQQQGLAIPKAYGTNKLFGNIIAGTIENINDKQYINVLISLGMGPWKRLYDFKLNDQPVENLYGVEIHSRLGQLDQEIIPNFNDTSIYNPCSLTVQYGSPVTYTTLADDFDNLEIDVSFPNGLWYANDMGGLDGYSVSYKIEVRPQGGEWETITSQVISVKQSATGRWSCGEWYTNNDGDITYWKEWYEGNNDIYSHHEGEPYYSNSNYFWRWLADVPYNYFVDETVDYVTVTGAKTQTIRRSHKTPNLDHGVYEIRVTNLTTAKNSSRYGETCVLSGIKEIYSDDFEYPSEVLVGIKALATDQLSGSLRFSCKGECQLVEIYDGTNWSVDVSTNPAWVAWNILTKPLFDNDSNVLEYRGYQTSQIDLDKFYEWAQFCDGLVPDGKGGTEKRVTFNAVFDRGINTWEALIDVCKAGRAVPIWTGNKLTLFIDKPAERTQMFTVGNTEIDSFEEIFLPRLERTAEIETDFLNVDKDFERDVATIINPEVEGLKSNSTAFGLTKPSEVWRDGQYKLAYSQYLTRAIKFSADADAIISTIGDRIGVQSDICKWGVEGGRVVSATSDSVTLDRQVEIQPGKTYAILVRLSDDSLVQKTITDSSGLYTTIHVSTPFTTLPQKFDIYSFGETTRIVKDFRIMELQASEELRFKISAIEYNESIYSTDYNQPALPSTNISMLEPFPSVYNIKAEERLIKSIDGSIRNTIDAYFTRPTSITYKHCEIWFKKDAEWAYAGISLNGRFTIENVDEQKTYTVAFVTINNLNQRQPISAAPKTSLYTFGKTAKPTTIINCWAQASIGGLRLDWTAVADVDLDYYKIRWTPDTDTGTWDNAIDITTTYATSITLPAAKNGIYFIKAVDTSGNESENAASLETNIPLILNWNVQEEMVEHPDFTGEKTNMFIENDELMLGSAELFDSDVMLDSDNDFDFGGGVAQTGYYETDVVDLGSVQTARCSSRIIFQSVNALEIFDDDVDMFDNTEMFDGDVSGVGLIPQIALSQDGSVWGDWQNFFVGDYTARAFKFRIYAYSVQAFNYLKVSELVFSVDMPDRYETGADEIIPAAGKTFTFNKSFMVKPRIGITMQSAQSGDFYELLNVTTSGFDIQIKNGSSGVQRTIDWEAKSY